MNSFPAILIGGPPHSGKSVLTYLLTRSLRAAKVAHYVLRACPDGEGDWSQEAPPEAVKLLRYKGEFSPTFVDRVCRDLEQRHLPLLVDVGGKPTPDQERIFDCCTHAVLLARDDAGLAMWRDLAERHGLAIVAELHSTLTGEDAISATTPVLRGQVAHLERHIATPGVAVAALAERLYEVLAYADAELRQHHLSNAPTELVVDLDQLATWLHLPPEQYRWQPAHLPGAIDYLPDAPVSLYGRGPGWLYTALALHIAPHPVHLFDARLGWSAPLPLMTAESAHPIHIAWCVEQHPSYTHIALSPSASYLDYAENVGAKLPRFASNQGIVLSGKLPHWLLVGAALAYRDHPWIAVWQAPLSDHAVIVCSCVDAYPLGAQILLKE
jgi:CRISPR-associated protein Csx3